MFIKSEPVAKTDNEPVTDNELETIVLPVILVTPVSYIFKLALVPYSHLPVNLFIPE